MKGISRFSIVWCLGLLFAGTACSAQTYTVADESRHGSSCRDRATACSEQMYTVNDLGPFQATGINASGQVVGTQNENGVFRTAPNSPFDPVGDNLVEPFASCVADHNNNPELYLYCVLWAIATGINDPGQVVGSTQMTDLLTPDYFGFRTGTVIQWRGGDTVFFGAPVPIAALGINSSGDTTGWYYGADNYPVAWSYSASSNRENEIGSLSEVQGWTMGIDINESDQVVGLSATESYCEIGGCLFHAFRTAPKSQINSATDDLGTLGGKNSYAYAINAGGQVVGAAAITGDTAQHAFRTGGNGPINPATDDLGTLGGSSSSAWANDEFGQVVGWADTTGDTAIHAFLFSNGVMHDLNSVIPTDSGCVLVGDTGGGSFDSLYFIPRGGGINKVGQIAVNALCKGQKRAVRLDPIYKANVQPPINADGSSVFNANRGVIPVKFTLTQYNAPTCTLLPATIMVTRASGGTFTTIDESDRDFRITGCQYHYNLAASALGVGTYRVDISINGIMVGHAVFALK